MKAGFTISITAHIIVLVILLVSFHPRVLPQAQETEQIPISLAPLAETMALQKGEANAPKKQKAAEKPTKTPPVKPNAQNAGDQKIDTQMPLNPKFKAREVKTPPPPKGDEQGKAQTPPPEKQPEPKPQEQPKPAEQPKAAPPAPKPAEQKPAEPTPPAPSSNAEPTDTVGDLLKTDNAAPAKPQEQKPAEAPKPAEQPKKQQEKPAEPQEPAPPAAPAVAPVPEPRPQDQAKGEADGGKNAQSNSALIDRTRTSGGGAKRSQGEEAFGASKNIGDNAALQQTLNNVIGGCVQRNWNIGIVQGSNAYDLQVKVHFKLDKNGNIIGTPDFTPSGGEEKDRQVIASQAQTALGLCAPFKLPPDKYDQWKEVIINMRAFPD